MLSKFCIVYIYFNVFSVKNITECIIIELQLHLITGMNK